MSKNRELSVNMLDLVEILVKRKRFILAIAFSGALVTAIYSFIVSPEYEATVVLMPPQGSSENAFGRILKSSPIGKIGGIDKMLSATPSNLTSTYMAILESRTIRMNLVHEFNLLHVYRFDRSRHYFIEDVLKKVNRHLSIDLDNELGTISVTVKDKSPKRAADMANFIASQLDETYKLQMTQKQHDLRVFLGERLHLVRLDLEAAEKNMLDFQKRHNITDAEAQAKASITVGANVEAQYLAARGNLEVARSTFSENHPVVRELKLELEQLEKQRRSLSDSHFSDLLVPYKSAPDIALDYMRLKREETVQQMIFDLILQQYEEAKFEESRNTPNVQVLDRADPPQKRIYPKRRKMVQIAFAASLLLASMLVLLREYARKFRKEKPEEYARFAGIARQLWVRRAKL
jgi:uncharacterized protein involved in exopolysaccharide biosynthesis